MSKNLYITATESRSGKSAISLGVMELLLRKVDRVGFFRPLISDNDGEKDNDIELISKHFNLGIAYDDMYAFTTTEANNMITHGKHEELIEGVFAKYSQIAAKYDFVLVEGTDFEGSTSAFEFDINAEIANNLGCPVLLVANAHRREVDDTVDAIEMAIESFNEKGCNLVGTIVNRTNGEHEEEIVQRLKSQVLKPDQLIYTIPNDPSLGNPTVAEIAQILSAKVLYGEEQLNRHVHGYTVAAMQLRNFLERLKHGSFIITPGDRADVILACLSTMVSVSVPNISGILLTGGLLPEPSIQKVIQGYTDLVPILSVDSSTFDAATILHDIHAVIYPHDTRKITSALGSFERNIDVEELTTKIIKTQTNIITPKMFEYNLIQRARTHKQHIVLPEGEESRILYAAEVLARRDVVNLSLLGNEEKIRNKIALLGLHLDGVNIIEPQKYQFFEDYVQTYYELRKHKGITLEQAHDTICDLSYFGTMMIHKGHADGMVSGAVHTTQATVRPAFEIIKTKPHSSLVSSVFFMCLEDRVLVYGDCAINPNPDAKALAGIAISSAETARIFGVDPRIAMLSYSTGASGKGAEVEKVREATNIVKELVPDLKIEGPIQYDAAVDLGVAKTKMPDSEVAGKANVFIFPDLNTGNNTYKAVQRTANAVAVGPVLQGLNKPVNDLSRGCTVPDIVNTVAITAIQAQAEKGLL